MDSHLNKKRRKFLILQRSIFIQLHNRIGSSLQVLNQPDIDSKTMLNF